jgi:hypothetical protein
LQRYTHAVHSGGRLTFRTRHADARCGSYGCGIKFLHDGHVCYGEVRHFDAVWGADGTAHGFVLVDAFTDGAGSCAPWLLADLDKPCVPLTAAATPTTVPLYISTHDICGQFTSNDGLHTSRGPVRVLLSRVHTHYANELLKLHDGEPEVVLRALLGLRSHSAAQPTTVSWTGAWPPELPGAVTPAAAPPAAAPAAGAGANNGGDDDGAAAMEMSDVESGELWDESGAAKRRRVVASMPPRPPSAQQRGKVAAAAIRAAAASAVPLGASAGLGARPCSQCTRPCRMYGCTHGCCSISCCQRLRQQRPDAPLCRQYGHRERVVEPNAVY